MTLPRLAALCLLSILAAAACGSGPSVTAATPGPCSPTRVETSTAQERTASPGPGIVTVLRYGGELRAGERAPMGWLIDDRRAGAELRLLGMRLENAADLVQAGPFPSTGSSTSNVHFESSIAFPRAGCWDLSISSGTAKGDLVLKVA
jgi:hypothetical protein